MKKRIFSVLLAAVLVFALTACGGSDDAEAAKEAEQAVENVNVVLINTDGLGQIASAAEGEEIEFSDETPMSSAQLNVPEGDSYTIAAKPDKGWKFVKWTENGEDFSTDEEIVVTPEDDATYVAVFEEE